MPGKRLAVLCALGVAGALVGVALAGSTALRVRTINDGDTLTLTDGRKVRLVQIDSPELGRGDCYAAAARRALLALVPVGTTVTLEADPRLDQVDRYGRLLRYVRRGPLNVNVELVRRGAAEPYFYNGDRGRYATLLLQAARSAKAARRGLWGACGATAAAPATTTTTVAAPTPVAAPVAAPVAGNCAASYPTVCIAPPPPDLDCGEITYRNFTVRWDVLSPDPHRFDGNHDGVGCEG